jgi:hypothetical protein
MVECGIYGFCGFSEFEFGRDDTDTRPNSRGSYARANATCNILYVGACGCRCSLLLLAIFLVLLCSSIVQVPCVLLGAAKLPRNVKKCNFQATGPGGYLSIPETYTMVERPNVVQNEQILPSSCIKTAFACNLLHLRAGKKSKNAPPT